jgi:hypothetical protein
MPRRYAAASRQRDVSPPLPDAAATRVMRHVSPRRRYLLPRHKELYVLLRQMSLRHA